MTEPHLTYRVLCENRSLPEESYEVGEFGSLEEAVDYAAEVVFDSLEELFEAGMSPSQLFDRYCLSGIAPRLQPDVPEFVADVVASRIVDSACQQFSERAAELKEIALQKAASLPWTDREKRRIDFLFTDQPYDEDRVKFIANVVKHALRFAKLADPEFDVKLGELESNGPVWASEKTSIGGYYDYSVFVQEALIEGTPPYALHITCSTSNGYDASESNVYVWVKGLRDGAYIVACAEHDSGKGRLCWKGIDIEEFVDQA